MTHLKRVYGPSMKIKFCNAVKLCWTFLKFTLAMMFLADCMIAAFILWDKHRKKHTRINQYSVTKSAFWRTCWFSSTLVPCHFAIACHWSSGRMANWPVPNRELCYFCKYQSIANPFGWESLPRATNIWEIRVWTCKPPCIFRLECAHTKKWQKSIYR